MQGAHDDADKGIALQTDFTDLYALRGYASISLGKIDEAIPDFTKAMLVTPREADLYRSRGLAQYCKGDFEGALDDYRQACLLSQPGQNASYAQYFAWCSQVKLGKAAEATKTLTTYMEKTESKRIEGWTKAVGEFLIDEKTEGELLKLAEAPTDTDERNNQLCEAYYYMAMKRFAADNKEGAKEYMKKCVDTDVFLFLEFEMARADVKRAG
jgi:lipoprotein NlpI